MDDNVLISYCELHSQTERALFSSTHINRMLLLAGFPDGYPRVVSGWNSVHQPEMQPLVDAARRRQKLKLVKG